MEENQHTKTVPKHAHHRRSSAKSNRFGDVRDLWSTANLSTTNVSVANVCENFDEEDKGKPRRYSQCISMKENLRLTPEEIQQQALLELEMRRGRSLERDLSVQEEQEGSEASLSVTMSASESSFSLSKQKPHNAYWTEQQNRLPLPLMELMESEVLEILKKSLYTYKSTIGRSHFLTKELQGYIDGIKKRQNKRLNCMAK